MRKMILLVLVLAGGMVAYNYFATGTITLMPAMSSSPELEKLNQLRAELREAKRNFKRASQATAVTAVDTSAQTEDARATARRIEVELGVLRGRLKTGAERERADRLLAETQQFLRISQ